MAGGRPPRLREIGDADAVRRVIDQWEASRRSEGLPLTYGSLSIALGLYDYQALWNYARPGEFVSPQSGATGGLIREFTEPIKEGLAKVASEYENLLFAGKPVGAIFALKQIVTGWTDRQEQVISLDAESWGQAIERAREHKKLKKQGRIEGKDVQKGASLGVSAPSSDADLE